MCTANRHKNDMKRFSPEQPDGYRETIRRGMQAVRLSCCRRDGDFETQTRRIRETLGAADAVVIGAGAGLSTSAGYTYAGDRFERWFADFAARFGITDMYSGGFYPFPDAETRWAWWSRHIYVNRLAPIPKPVYDDLLTLVKDKDYFVLTTNVDHCFQRAGFDKQRLFYTQGDYGLLQTADGLDGETYDVTDRIPAMLEAQGFQRGTDGVYQPPEDAASLAMRVPSALVPRDSTGREMKMNLRADDTFVEDAGWRRASAAYADFLRRHEGRKVVFLELGVGANTPVIIKYPFWQMTLENENATYVCLSRSSAFCPDAIADRSICLNHDVGAVLEHLTSAE